MTTRALAILVLLGFVNTAGAVRVLRQVERPFELTVGQLTLPRDTGGSLLLRSCDTCRVTSHRLQGTTKFVLDGREIAYEDFARTVNALRGGLDAETTSVSVFVDLDTERVTRIAVRRPHR